MCPDELDELGVLLSKDRNFILKLYGPLSLHQLVRFLVDFGPLIVFSETVVYFTRTP